MPDVRKLLKNKWIMIPASILLIAFILCTVSYSYYKNSIYKPMSANDIKTVVVNIPGGSTSVRIASILYNNGLIKSETTYKVYLKLNKINGKLKAGKYEFSTDMSAVEITDRMIKGEIKKDTVKVTIPEGKDTKSIADIIEKSGLVSKDKFIDAAQNSSFDYDFLKNIPKRPFKLEGYLFPDTYEFPKDATAEQIINRMLKRFGEVFNDDMKSRAASQNITIDKVVTIASMVEGEARVPEERPVISAVIYNRLKSNMNLQIDATVLYALGQHKESVSLNDLKVDSPYNTYKYNGLPLGPINNPGKASIEAALNPEKVNYLYYVLKKDGNGSHVFSDTYQEHLKKIAENR